MQGRLVVACALAFASGCFESESPSTTVESTPLLGDSCTPNACMPGQCGVVRDGCRSEMWCGDCACGPSDLACERSLSPVFDAPLAAGSFVIATSGLSAGADPVIHVVDGAGHEVAFDDDSGGSRNAVAVGTLASPGRVIIRAKSEATRGTAMASVNGPWQPITIGGTFQTMTGLRPGEAVESVKLFGSRTDSHVIYVLATDGLHLTTRVAANATSGGALWASTSSGTHTLVFGTLGAAEQPSRLLRNDAALLFHDSDGDGLGNELEAALGTCASASSIATGRDGIQFDCKLANDVRDTDGDGLSDAIEVRGVRNVSPHQPLALWGADPRHKDLFVEVDASQLEAGGGTPKLTAADARRFSDYYGDRTRELDPFIALYHAASLKNPDQQPGIRTHLDTGVAPQAPSDERIYGDWGGWSVVPPAPGGGGQNANVVFQTFMTPARLGVFRYAFWYVGIGGTNGTGSWTCIGCGTYAWGSGNEIDTFTHESVHAHGLGHSGPAKPSGEVDPNCKASYPSIVNYAFQSSGYGLSDGLGFPGLNNVAAPEWNAIPPAQQGTLATLRDVFDYRVDPTKGHVDWNRDGVFAPAGSTVRAYTNYLTDTQCEFTRYNSEQLSSSLNTRVSPAFGRHGSTAFLFSGGTSSLRYVTAPSPFDCAQTSSTPCVTWSATQTLGIDATLGVDATRVASGLLVVTVGADGTVSYVNRYTSGGFPRWSTPQPVPGADLATGEPSLVSLPDGSALLLYRRASGELVEAQFTVPSLKGVGGWARVGLARRTTGSTIVQAPQAAPGLVHAAFTNVGPTTYGLFAETPDAVLRLWQYLPATRQWQASPIPVDDSNIWWRSVSGRPAAVWVPGADNAQGGRLYVIATSRDGHEGNPDLRGTGRGIILRWSYAHPTTGQLRLGMTAGYQTEWSFSFGVDAWFDPGTDDNLRVAWSLSPFINPNDPAIDSRIQFDPKGDGLNDYMQTNFNDWPYVGFALCKALVDPLGTATNPIQCGTRPFVPSP